MKPQRPVLIAPPAELPVSLGDVKALLRVDSSDEDALITDMIAAATSRLDGWGGSLGRCIVTQEWSQSFDGFPETGTLDLPFPDVSEATISYFDAAGDAQAFTSFRLAAGIGGSSQIVLNDGAAWPASVVRPDAVTVTMTVGYGAAENVPPILRHAIKVLAAAMFEGREGQMTGSPAFGEWTAPYRCVGT